MNKTQVLYPGLSFMFIQTYQTGFLRKNRKSLTPKRVFERVRDMGGGSTGHPESTKQQEIIRKFSMSWMSCPIPVNRIKCILLN